MAWSLDSSSRQYFFFPLCSPSPVWLPLCCLVFYVHAPLFFCLATFLLKQVWPSSWHPSTSPFPPATALQGYCSSVSKYSLSPSFTYSVIPWILAAGCSRGAEPSARVSLTASPSAAPFPRGFTPPVPRETLFLSRDAFNFVPSFVSVRTLSFGLPLRFRRSSVSLPSGFPVSSSVGVSRLRWAACPQTLLSFPLDLFSVFLRYAFPACPVCIPVLILVLSYIFLKRRSTTAARHPHPRNQRRQSGVHAPASPQHRLWLLPSLLRLCGLRRTLFSSSSAATRVASPSPSTPGDATRDTAFTLHAISAAHTDPGADFSAAPRTAARSSPLFVSLTSTASCNKLTPTHLNPASTGLPSATSARASAVAAAECAAASVAVQSAVAADQAAASCASAALAQHQEQADAGDFLGGTARKSDPGRSPSASPHASPETGVLTHFFPSSAPAAVATLPAARLLFSGGTLSQAACTYGRKQKRRPRLPRWFSVIRGACDILLLAAFLSLTAASFGCGAKRHFEASLRYHKSTPAPPYRPYVRFSSFHAPPPSSASPPHPLPGASAETLGRFPRAFEVRHPSRSLGNFFAVCESYFPALLFPSSSRFFLPPTRRQPSLSPVHHYLRSGDKPSCSAPLTSSISPSRHCSGGFAFSISLPETSHPDNSGILSFSSSSADVPSSGRVPSSFSSSSHLWSAGVFPPLRTASSLRSTTVSAPSSFLLFASSSHPSPASSSPPPPLNPPPLPSYFSWTASSLWQPPAPLFSLSRSRHGRLPSCDFYSLGRRLATQLNDRLKLCLAAVRRHGRPGTGSQTTRDMQQDSEEEEEATLTRLPYIPRKDAEEAGRQQGGDISTEQPYDFFTGSSALTTGEEPEGGDQSQHLETVLQNTSRFGSLTDPGEPPTPPPPSPFWPSYPPKKVSALPRGRLPRWHPRSPFPPLQPRGPFYPQQEEQHRQQRPQPPRSSEEQKSKTGAYSEGGKRAKENDRGRGTCVGLPEKPPDLPKNYRNWVRDSRYKYPQFTTLTASLKYRRRLKRSSRKLDWRLKNVQFRRMYFAWRRNMRDQEMHRWMREKIRWSKLAAEYWKREYTRQQEEWTTKTRLQPQTQEEGVLAQEAGEASTDTQKRPPEQEIEPQTGLGGRGESFAAEGLPVERGDTATSPEAFHRKKEERVPTEAHGTGRRIKPATQEETTKTPVSCSAEKVASASLSAFDANVSSAEPVDKPTSESSYHRREEGKTTARRQPGTEEEGRVEEDGMKSRDELDTEEKSEVDDGGNVTLRDLASRVLSLSSPQEIRDIIINGYRLPPLTAAVAASPIPWWASRKGEHKWRGKNTATNVQSRWVNWANPHRLVEAAVGQCLLPREGGVLELLREKGEKLKQALERVQRGEDAAALCADSKNGEEGESPGEQQSLSRWSDEGQQIEEGLREMWERKKMQKREKGREREGVGSETEEEKGKTQPVSLAEVGVSTVSRDEQAENDGEAGGRKAQRGENQDQIAEDTKQHEATAAREDKEEQGKRPSVGYSSPPEGARKLPTETEEATRSSQSLTSSTSGAQVKCATYTDMAESRKEPVEGLAGQSAQQSPRRAMESLVGNLNASAMQHTSDIDTARVGRHLVSPLNGTGVNSFLDDREKQRKAIEAAIDVSLMLGHSTIVKTQGAAVPYDVYNPFMRSHTSSRRRRMRLRGRGRDPDKRNMTRQERRLANRDARLEQEKRRKEAAKAARRRAWEDSQRLHSSADPEV